MKRETTRHPKFKHLKRALQRQDYQVVGVLESLWEITAGFFEDGGIGRWSNAQIAEAIEWDGDANNLILCLVSSGWLDEVDDAARLVIHDWYTHVYPGQWDRIRGRVRRAIGSNKAPAWQVAMFEKARIERSNKSDSGDDGDPDGADRPAASGPVRQRPDMPPPNPVLSGSSSSSSPPPSPPPRGGSEVGEGPKAADPVVMTFVCDDGAAWPLTASHLGELDAAFGGKVAVEACLRDPVKRQDREESLRRPSTKMATFLRNYLKKDAKDIHQFPPASPPPAKPNEPKPAARAGGVVDRTMQMLEAS